MGKVFIGVKAIIFDLDGTLYDFKRMPFHLVMAKPSEAFVIKAERTVRRELKGCDFYSPEAYYDSFFKQLAIYTHKTEESARNWYFNEYMPRMYRTLEKHYTARPGVLSLFDALRQAGIEFAVYSDYSDTAERLAALGLPPDRCGKLYGPETFGALKPAIRPFISIAQALGSPCEDTLVIGDREDTDGSGALACGMRFIRIKTHKTKKSDISDGIPLYTWDQLYDELMQYAETLSLVHEGLHF
ncbi:HAD family hydrolase [Brucepastera parasyntrophica]|uniref:HAD family hydrolase n=1 Tax=Brucepastera parasyntrophica TaxID=2880008 RepID=UPI002109865B|nr:HAD family hydrolase [Brucepastera parasyntrophica]ULQ59001.1 HAD family hydrolase [Brucepastera parasyntrophica]